MSVESDCIRLLFTLDGLWPFS